MRAQKLDHLGREPDAPTAKRVEVRMHRASPLFKLYVLNGEEVFFGFYPVVERTVAIKGEPMAIYDLLGKDVQLFPYTGHRRRVSRV